MLKVSSKNKWVLRFAMILKSLPCGLNILTPICVYSYHLGLSLFGFILKVEVSFLSYPVGTRPKMNVFCRFKIGPFVPIKKGPLLDVLKIIFIFHLTVLQLRFEYMRKIVIFLLSMKHFNFMIWNFMALFEGM